jgi:hypothetical protein
MLSQFLKALSPTDKYWLVAADAFTTSYRTHSKDKGSTVSLFRFLVSGFSPFMLYHLNTTPGFIVYLGSYSSDAMRPALTKTVVLSCQMLRLQCLHSVYIFKSNRSYLVV